MGHMLGKAPPAVIISDFDTSGSPPAISAVMTNTDLSFNGVAMASVCIPSVKIAFSTDPLETPVWDDLSGVGLSIRTSRGRQHELDRMRTGTADVRLLNRDGNLWPDNTSGKFTGEVLPGKRLECAFIFNNTTYPVFTGFIESYEHGFLDRGNDQNAVVDIMAADALKLYALHEIESGSEVEEKSGTRIGNILDLIGIAAGDRDFDTGLSDIVAITFDDDNAMDHLQRVTDTELGLLYISGDGTAVFHDRAARQVDSEKTTSQATYGEDGAELPYQEIEFDHDDQRLFNTVSLTRDGGTEQTDTDTDSETAYGKRSLNRSGLLHTGDTEVLNQAQYLLGRHKDSEMRVRRLTINPERSPAAEFPDVLDFDIATRVTVRLDVASIDDPYWIEGIDLDYLARDNNLRCSWWLSPADPQAYWRLGTAGYSEIGQTTVLGY